MRPLVRVLAVLVVVGASLLSPVATSAPAQQAQAADTRQFNPGNIISDAVFFDGRAMDAAGIQDFLRSKRSGSCPNPAVDTSPCLSDFRTNTTNRAADSLCAGYQGAAGESAATIIAKVAVSCRVNPRVILVLLQKEMGFITSSNPTAKMYDRAAGYYCPDIGTGWCHPDYAGLQKQLYNSARQYQRYAAYPSNYSYRAGRNNVVQWDVPSSCGTSVVYIQNQATAGLYNYTPYRPNQAALNAGYGTGDSCSAYGNRNFWLYYTDWFGSTQFSAGSYVRVRAAAADTQGLIGSATSNVICGLKDGGCFQPFQRGAIYWSPSSGAQIIRGALHERWAGLSWETGPLGYPTGEERCGLKDGGCFQDFQLGAIYWSPASGAHPIRGALRAKWASTLWETGYLGYPTAAERCGLTGAGCYQQFQGGRIYWSSTSGPHVMVAGAVWNAWKARGYEMSTLGYPTGEQACGLRDGGCGQNFTNGAVYWSPATGAQPVLGGIRDKWAGTRWEAGQLGYPTSGEQCGLTGKGCLQQFQGGRIYWSPATGAHVTVPGPVWEFWGDRGYEAGPLGYPRGDQKCGLRDGGCVQTFQNALVAWSPATGAQPVLGGIRNKWAGTRWEAGQLGYPTSGEQCGLTGKGCLQQFQGGRIYWSPATGAHVTVPGPVWDFWEEQGSETGPLGYPRGDHACGLRDGGCVQTFQGGAISSAPATGTRSIQGEIHEAWAARGREKGTLGYPTSEEKCGLAGGRCNQYFQGGIVISSAETGTYVVWGAISRAWLRNPSVLGYPTSGENCGLVRSGCFQVFQKGHLYWSPTTGAHPVSGKIFSTWGAQGWERGALGYPTGAAVTTPSTITQTFQGGTLVQNRSTGTVTRK